MQFTKIAVVILVLVVRTSQGGIVIATPDQDGSNPSLVDDLVEMVASCYGDRIQVGLIGHVRDDLPRALSAKHFIPVVLMDSSRSYTYTSGTQFHHKLHVFIADVISDGHFRFIIRERLKYSIWWNLMAPVFVLDRSPGCKRATGYLLTAWDVDVLNAKILCHDIDDGRVIVTYNPFTSTAPIPWLHIFIVPGVDSHPFTLLKREYRRNATICVNLDFDKTKNFGGYPVLVRGYPLGYEVCSYRNLRKIQDWRRRERILYTFSNALNISLHFVGLSAFNWDIVNGEHFLRNTYPYREIGSVIVTQFRGHKSQLNKILSVIDVDSRIGLGIVYLITLMFLKFFVHQALVPALLNLVRITCDTGFTNLPNNTASRIYLTSLLFFAVTMQGIYQGNLAALLTQQIPLQQVNTMQDVVKFGYKLYANGVEQNLINNLKLDERFTRVEQYEDCVTYVINDSSAACLWGSAGVIYDMAREFDLHISNEFIERRYMGLRTRSDWSLQRRVDAIIKRMVEADVVESWNDKCNPVILSDFQFDVEVRKNKDFKIIELSELTFSFVILGIGLVCATITLIAEIAIQYKCIFIDRQNPN